MYGAILGDIIGSPFEFDRGNKTKEFELFTDGCDFTDDSVMTLAVAAALMEAGPDASEEYIKETLIYSMQEWGRDYPHAGYGGGFRRWLKSSNPKPYNSWGNGSAMRVAFVGDFYEDYDEMQAMAAKTAEVSHNHPEGIKGAVVTATCIWMAKCGKSKQEIYDYVLSEYPVDLYEYSIGNSLDDIRPRYKWNESCQGSVPAAMRCFYESTDYESFMRNIYSLPCDSDTFGAIAGGVAEEFYHGFGDIDAQGIFKKHLSDDLYEILMR